MQNFSDVKYCNAKETFLNSGLNGEGVGKCAFSTENWQCLESGDRYD